MTPRRSSRYQRPRVGASSPKRTGRMSSEFQQATAVRIDDTDGPGGYVGLVPERWQQGRGAFGGVVVGILARAIVDASARKGDEARLLRSLSADLCAPLLPGAVRLKTEEIRRGGSASFVDARLI